MSYQSNAGIPPRRIPILPPRQPPQLEAIPVEIGEEWPTIPDAPESNRIAESRAPKGSTKH